MDGRRASYNSFESQPSPYGIVPSKKLSTSHQSPESGRRFLFSDSSSEISESSYEMSRVDWRWAAEKGYYDRAAKRWIAETGGYEAYSRQRLLKRRRKLASKGISTVENQAISLAELASTTLAVERPLAFNTQGVDFEQV